MIPSLGSRIAALSRIGRLRWSYDSRVSNQMARITFPAVVAGNLLDGSMIAHDPRSPNNHEATIISGAQRGGVNRTRNWVAFGLIGVAEPLSPAHRSCFFSFFFHSLSIGWPSSRLLSESVLGPRHTIAEGREIIAKSAGCCA